METLTEIQTSKYSLADLTRYFLKLGTFGLGGPVALIGYMHRDLVEERGWINDDEYREGLALAQLAPGPLAAQFGIYLGYVHYGVWGYAHRNCLCAPFFFHGRVTRYGL
jgi:chromate transporter